MIWMGANGIQQANKITIKKGLYVFFNQKNLFIWINFGTIFLQLVVINAHGCPST
jgi:hypothetical protein